MEVALIGLAGVVLGAASTGWVSWLFARRSEQAELRQARRRVATELGRIAQDLGVIIKAQRANTLDGFLLTNVWREEERSLARNVRDDEWERLSLAYENLEAMRQLL